MNDDDFIVEREYPWSIVPPIERRIVRRSRIHWLLTRYLRENPPTKQSFRIKNLAEEFGCSWMSLYQNLRTYSNDSKRFLKYIPVPIKIAEEEKSWEYAVEKLHEQGFYFVQPLEYHTGNWGEPTFAAFEEYDTRYLKEAFNRVFYRIRDAKDFNLKLDGIDVRKELKYVQKRLDMLTDKTEEIEESQ